ncbi:hypothetical protein GWO43_05095 [candidate division KSB1 bacterium]|nr:hypothetical protein [candidate division KSB1 bacterium]NIR71460.1 hypothetical protein [candidate division KSB1 bacterium]NIS23381.1 hypothetical protein [candidate division KSB1 bacterium]NIT70272.1 hypothetical protein [candidate division KSB1 bacterium]NIU23995.1 hypothetical protein [candidate division KSB1 bacterium]
MRSQTLMLLFCSILAISVLNCKSDLVPAKLPDLGADPYAYCNLDDDRRLVVTVQNRGRADAPASKTRIKFFTTGGEVDMDLDTPKVPAGTSVELTPHIDIPPDCTSPIWECKFEIIVDVNDDVDELNEGNNTVTGKCGEASTS